ncbi:ribonuclease catalytic domain-containing protein [Thermodesulfobacteriota bacterium]
MNQGKVVEYIDQGKFVCAICLQDKGNRLHLLTASNREVNLSPKRAILISNLSNNVDIPREELLEKLKYFEETRERLKKEINAKELWELIHEESESFEHEYLAQLAFGEEINDDHTSALVRALFENRLYFKIRDSKLLPHSKNRVEQIIEQKEEESKKENLLGEGSKWLLDILAGKNPSEPDCADKTRGLLTQLALYGKDAQGFKYGKELLSRTGISDISKSFDLLVRMGVWDRDENLELLRYGISSDFTPKQKEAASLSASEAISPEGRKDLRDLPTITIDGLQTRDFDDAISLEIINDELKLGVHISDVAAIISPDSILDKMAAERCSSLYMPCKHIPMIPTDLSQDTLSLKQGCDRYAVSLIARFSLDGTLLEHHFLPSIINVKRQMTYDQVNALIVDDPELSTMHKLSRQMWQKRIDKGAMNLSLPELNIVFNSDASFSIESVEQETPSRMIVSEFMILYNSLMAKFCLENEIPVLFRAQEKPSELLARDELGYLYYVFQQRRKLRPLKISTTPAPHSGLGLDLYTHATSPIRRYLDIVAQRQVKGFLAGGQPDYDRKDLENMIILIAPALRELDMVKRNRLRYWILKYLSQNIGEKYKAFILDELKSKYRVVLEEFQLIAEIKRQNGVIYKTGQKVKAEVKKAEPRSDLLRLEIYDS